MDKYGSKLDQPLDRVESSPGRSENRMNLSLRGYLQIQIAHLLAQSHLRIQISSFWDRPCRTYAYRDRD